VNDAIGRGRTSPQAIEIVEIASVHLGAGGLYGHGALIRAGKAEHLVPRIQQLANDGRTDPSGRTGNEYAHSQSSYRVMVSSIGG
jgi:hypothetical protein